MKLGLVGGGGIGSLRTRTRYFSGGEKISEMTGNTFVFAG